MKAILLSAGRGSRLLPLTENQPKCLLEFGGRSVLRHQFDLLEEAGIEEAIVVTGFLPGLVEAEADAWNGRMRVSTLFNPFFHVADNLASCWMARAEMDGPFLLINGDTLFELSLLRDVLAAPEQPILVTVDRKDTYDSDDMKVTLDGMRLIAISKQLSTEDSHAESIGLLRFSGEGASVFRDKLEQMMRTQDGVSAWFLSAVDAIARTGPHVHAHSIEGHYWSELDTREDYEALVARQPDLRG